MNKYTILLLSLVLLSSCASPGGMRIDNYPMYGQPEISRPDFLQKADEDFINKVGTEFGDRKKASTMWWQQGDKFANEGNLDYAMRRYNQSWLLDPENYQPYWGFARVKTATREYEEAFKYFKKANELIDDPYQKPALLTDTALGYHNKANSLDKNNTQERDKYFTLANSKFEESTKLDPTYPNAWAAWAHSLYFQDNYKESWVKVKKALELDASLVSDTLLQNLKNKMPEPLQKK